MKQIDTRAEMFDERTVMTREGDILPTDDLPEDERHTMSNHGRIQRSVAAAVYHADEAAALADQARSDRLREVRGTADFGPRNTVLTQLATQVGTEKRHLGAVDRMRSGGEVWPYVDYAHAERLALDVSGQIRQLGAEACAACPLAEFCDIPEGTLRFDLDHPRARARFRRRAQKNDNAHLCETNLQPGRIRDTQA